ncbi:hypothetical protein DJ93_208 [Bacillus clarus]|uniref:Uncharacterized protein n=1 Tax=Bacillus clarus TaxID=2338372 RepID=A0A090YMK5_9BACI|nr:hypothetical protein DJ93_208 [Bacillus clarus]
MFVQPEEVELYYHKWNEMCAEILKSALASFRKQKLLFAILRC